MILDPSAISFVQTTFLFHIDKAFATIANYSRNLLFIFAIFEIVIFGLLWAFGQSASWGHFFFKVLKIGIIFFIIQNYSWLLGTIIRSFAQIGGVVADTQHLDKFIFNPAKIWQFGYDVSLALLKSAAISTSFGLSLLMLTLGLGMLFIFGLLGIQIILQLVGFYLVSLIALILLPLGVFNPSVNMFDKSVQSVLKAGIRVAVLIMVIGVAVTIWKVFGFTSLPEQFNLNQLLGLFFTSLLFLCLAIWLPGLAANTVGQISMRSRREDGGMVTFVPAVGATASAPSLGGLANMQAATAISPSGQMMPSAVAVSGQAGMAGMAMAASTQAAQPVVNAASSAGMMAAQGVQKNNLKSASVIEKSISDATIKKIKKTFVDVMKENNDS